MGKQWLLFKVTGDGGGSHGTAAKSSSTTNTNLAGKSRNKRGNKPISSSSGGCMNAFFHLFDIQHHHFPFNQPSFISESSSINITQEPNLILKGVEAPRNSLEEQEPMAEKVVSSSSTSSSSKPQKETNFNIPKGGIQIIKTKKSRLMDDESSECSSSSPGTKTPSLVARLMGLDLLPENSSPRTSLSSPRPSSSSSHATPLSKLSYVKTNTRSLPATPRISTAARPSTEVDYHHRHSLQVNKENKRRHNESTSEYAKQIAQQVRENISRRVGADITNTLQKKEQRRDEFLVVLKPKRPSPPSSAVDKSRNLDQGYGGGKENEPMPLSCSPRLRLLEIKNNLNKPVSNLAKTLSAEVIKTPLSSSSTIKSAPLVKEEVLQVVKNENTLIKVQKCKKIASEKYDLRLKRMNQEENKCTKRKCNNKKSTPLSNHLVNGVNTTTKFISFKKDMASPSTLSQKQVSLESITQLPSCQSRSYKTTKIHKLSDQDNVSTNGNGIAAVTTTTSGGSVDDYFDYISTILSHSGIEKTTLISITLWYSPSHPLHPSILEKLNQHPIVVAANFADRKLIFDVTDELLVEILKPYLSLKPWAIMGQRYSHRMYGSELIGKLYDKISSFPAADCKVLEDIDGLIEGDMRSSRRLIGDIAFEEEAAELVAELERDMVDTLVGEMAAGIIWHVGDGGKL